jgi:type I restriction enzyme M protein
MLVTGHNPDQIAFGNTLTDDAHPGRQFHYILSNPPYGVDWKKYQDRVREEHLTLGANGRFGPGLPRVSDGQLLFLLHMVSKMRNDEQGSRIGIVMNASPLFSGGAGSGESEIRRWMLENDLIEAIVALPTDLFYNTGIQTFVWLLNNRKAPGRRRKVQLIDATSERFWQPMRKSLGSKRREIPKDARDEIVRMYEDMLNGGSAYDEFSKIFDFEDFGYREIRVERPLRLSFQVTDERLQALALDRTVLRLSDGERDGLLEFLRASFTDEDIFMSRKSFEKALSQHAKSSNRKIGPPIRKAILNLFAERNENADPCVDSDGRPEPDTNLRDHELVPLTENWLDFFAREVRPFVPDAWVDELYRDERDKSTGRIGFEINFNRFFFKYAPPRPLQEINKEMKQLEADIAALLSEIAA